MAKQFDLHPLAVEDARHGHQRPKIEEYGDQLFAVLHTVEMRRRRAQVRRGQTSSWAGTSCSPCAAAPSTASRRCASAPSASPSCCKHGSGFVFYALIDNVVDRYFPLVDALEAELEKIEARIFEGTAASRVNIESLYDLKRKLMVGAPRRRAADRGGAQALRRARAAGVRRAPRTTFATSTTTCCA